MTRTFRPLAFLLLILATLLCVAGMGPALANVVPPSGDAPASNPALTWTPPPEPALKPVPATSCPTRPTAGKAACLSEVDGTVPDQQAAQAGKAEAVATSDTAASPLPDSAVPQAESKSGAYTPADLASLYQIPAGLTTHATIGIIDVGSDPNTPAQLNFYRKYFSLPACTTSNGCFREVGQNGGAKPSTTNSGWVDEIALDVQAVSAICPTCHILLVDASSASSSDLGAAALTAVRLGATYVSMSYGSADSAANGSLNLTYYNEPNVTYVAASGDSGYAGGTIFPSSASNVVAVGGTSAKLVNGQWQQSAWSGGGSGCSSTGLLGVVGSLVQSVLSGTACPSGRAVSDVSALADPNTGIMFYRGGTWWSGGGTSLAAPIVAALYALAGNHTNPLAIYQNVSHTPSSFVDITSGTNGSCGTTLCKAGAGWDGPTGIGTPAGLNGLAANGSASLPLAAPHTAGRLTLSSGYPTELHYQLVDALTGAPVAGARVNIQASTGAGYRTVASGTTNANGVLGYAALPRVPTSYRVSFPGNVTATASTSASVRVSSFSVRVQAKAAKKKVKVVATAPWNGAAANVPLMLQRKAAGHWANVKRGSTSSAGRASLKARRAGHYRVAYGGGQWRSGDTGKVRVRARH